MGLKKKMKTNNVSEFYNTEDQNMSVTHEQAENPAGSRKSVLDSCLSFTQMAQNYCVGG